MLIGVKGPKINVVICDLSLYKSHYIKIIFNAKWPRTNQHENKMLLCAICRYIVSRYIRFSL